MRLRFGNAGVDPGSESNALTSISHETDGDLTYKSDNGSGGRSTGTVTPGLDTLHAVTIVMNVSGVIINYDIGAGNVALAANSFDFYVDGSSVATALPFHLDASTGYDPLLGIGKLGWVGASNAGTGIDLQVDDVMITTIVPEPSTYAVLLGALALAFVFVRRRK